MLTITGLDKAELLAALVNNARPQGRGVFRDSGHAMTKAEAQTVIERNKHLDFDYVNGRPIKSCLKGDVLDEFLYDRDNGQGAAARVIATLRAGR